MRQLLEGGGVGHMVRRGAEGSVDQLLEDRRRGRSGGAERVQQLVQELPRKGMRHLGWKREVSSVQLLRVNGGGRRVEKGFNLGRIQLRVGLPGCRCDRERDAAQSGEKGFASGRVGDVLEVGHVCTPHQA